MTAHQTIDRPVFPAETLDAMERLYPLQAGLLHHRLPDHPLLSLAALADLGERLPAAQVEYNQGALPVGIPPADHTQNGLSIGEPTSTHDTNPHLARPKTITRDHAHSPTHQGQ